MIFLASYIISFISCYTLQDFALYYHGIGVFSFYTYYMLIYLFLHNKRKSTLYSTTPCQYAILLRYVRYIRGSVMSYFILFLTAI